VGRPYALLLAGHDTQAGTALPGGSDVRSAVLA
jgi:hypothetical protein